MSWCSVVPCAILMTRSWWLLRMRLNVLVRSSIWYISPLALPEKRRGPSFARQRISAPTLAYQCSTSVLASTTATRPSRPAVKKHWLCMCVCLSVLVPRCLCVHKCKCITQRHSQCCVCVCLSLSLCLCVYTKYVQYYTHMIRNYNARYCHVVVIELGYASWSATWLGRWALGQSWQRHRLGLFAVALLRHLAASGPLVLLKLCRDL